jgi:hypothetical protein
MTGVTGSIPFTSTSTYPKAKILIHPGALANISETGLFDSLAFLFFKN